VPSESRMGSSDGGEASASFMLPFLAEKSVR